MTHAEHIAILRRHAHELLDETIATLTRFHGDEESTAAAYIDAMRRLERANTALAFLQARGNVAAIASDEVRADVLRIIESAQEDPPAESNGLSTAA